MPYPINRYADQLAEIWFTHWVEVHPLPTRTIRGVQPGRPTMVKASIRMEQHTVTVGSTAQGEEVLANGTLHWRADGVVPKVGQTVLLPPEFGEQREREVIAARVVYSGTGLTPDHVEVKIR